MNRRVERRSLKAFLSHRYKSPEVNQHFFRLFSRAAEVQFEVDLGQIATNVTRLERMVRNADAFIGIYPFPKPPDQPVDIRDLRQESRYFRLELDLAMRAHVPAIVFSDVRYASVLACPDWIQQYTFDAREVEGTGSKPSEQQYVKAFRWFGDMVQALRTYRASAATFQRERSKVGLLVPTADAGLEGYSREDTARVRRLLEGCGREVLEFPWPPVLNKDFHAALSNLDWIVAEIGPVVAQTGIVGFLHGQFIPTLRLQRCRSQEESLGAANEALFGAFEVGYAKDVVRWTVSDELEAGVAARLKTLLLPARLIDTYENAQAYFQAAALRNEAVFVSYSGKDADLARRIIASLKTVFKNVFDYKDGESIRPGRPWLEEIFQNLSQAAIAIPLLSREYLASGNCMHEAREIMARRDMGKLQILPIKLDQEKLDLPSWLQDTQYLRISDIAAPQEVGVAVAGLLGTAPLR